MARKVRIFVENTSQHVLLKSLNSLKLFKEKSDYQMFMTILQNLHDTYEVAIHAYALLPNSFEFLATPKHKDSLSKFMQNLGRNYVVYFNKKYNRSGTLWEGRYKASIVDDREYLIDVMKYIEQLVPITHKFSSLHKNLLNKKDSLVSQNSFYKEFGFTDAKRLELYSKHFYKSMDPKRHNFIQNCLEKQLVTGNLDFIKNLEKKIGMTLISNTRGRPKKSTILKRKKMYKNLVVLDKEQHKEIKINNLDSLSYAKELGYVPVTAIETSLVAQAFPVVFTADKEPSLVAIVSLGSDSLAINNEGKWISSYVPSYLRKYPFSLASTQENPDQKVILIDEDSPLFSKSRGKQLFKKSGEQSETLEHAIKFLTEQETQMNITKNVAQLIANSGILEDREISVGEDDEKKVLVEGFKVVDREKLNALSDDILADWTRKGIITLIDAHINSLTHIDTLFKLAMQKQNIA